MSEDAAEVQAYTVRLELVDRPGELLRALRPIADNGGNLLAILHERGKMTPRGHVPVEVDLECPPGRFEAVVEAVREAGINVIQAGADRFGEEVAVLLVGDLIETDLSDTIERIEAGSSVRVVDLSLAAPEGTDAASAALVRLAAERGTIAAALGTVRELAAEKGVRVVEPAAVEGDG